MAAASPSCSETLTISKNCSTVVVSNDLMQLIKDPAEKEAFPPSVFAHLTTMDELLMHVKNYIVKNKLYDPSNPLKILVHGNELGSLLGKSEFSLLDVRDILLKKFVFPVAQKNYFEFSAKRMKGFDDASDSDESMYSFQDYETEFVKDSASDDNFSVNGLIITETFDVDVEYEIQTDSECSYESDSSDLEDFVKSAIINFIARTSDSDLEYLADGSSDDESEKELSEEDKWRCLSCGTLNDPVMRNCCACWKTTRVGWLPERSERQNENTRESKRKAFVRSKRKNSKKSNKNKDSSNCKLSDLSNATTESSSSYDNPDLALSDLPKKSATEESLSLPSTSSNDNSDAIQSPLNTLEADKDKNTKTELDKKLCLFCCARPADSTIIHGRVGCPVCCFACGQKFFSENKRCPVCRRNIERIVYIFNNS